LVSYEMIKAVGDATPRGRRSWRCRARAHAGEHPERLAAAASRLVTAAAAGWIARPFDRATTPQIQSPGAKARIVLSGARMMTKSARTLLLGATLAAAVPSLAHAQQRPGIGSRIMRFFGFARTAAAPTPSRIATPTRAATPLRPATPAAAPVAQTIVRTAPVAAPVAQARFIAPAVQAQAAPAVRPGARTEIASEVYGLEASIRQNATPPFAFVSLSPGVNLVQTRYSNYKSGIHGQVEVRGLGTDGKISLASLLPVSAHTGEWAAFAKSNVYDVNVRHADGRSESFVVKSTGLVTEHQLDLTLAKGTSTITFAPRGSGGVGGFPSGRTLDFIVK
jgi:hypothetical protein